MHHDQADTLRRLMQQRKAKEFDGAASGPSAQVITVSSGKGGVGKSCLVANLGALLARSGLRVLLVDGDFGLANLDILVGVQTNATLEQVLDGKASLQEAIVGIEPNLWLLPAGAGLQEARSSGPGTRDRLLTLFESCPWEMDVILVDVGAGIQSNVLEMHHPSYESLVVLTPEPTSLTDAYSLIKLLRRHEGITRVSVVVNQVTDGREGQLAFQRLREVASRFIDVQLEYLGHWQRDEKITQSVMKRRILVDLDPGAVSVPSLELLAKRLRAKFSTLADDKYGANPGAMRSAPGRFKDEPALSAPGNTARFWRTLLGEVKA